MTVPVANRKPPWLKRPLPAGKNYSETARLLRRLNLNTVCQEALCPNIGECWSRRIATIMVLGSKCTRGCRFCSVSTQKPDAVDPSEPHRVAQATSELGFRHVVITMVTRDDLPDGGAAHLAATFREVRRRCPRMTLELLSSDFRGKFEGLPEVVQSGVDLWGHNLETVPRLYRRVRPGARHERSLEIFRRLRSLSKSLPLKSALMLGLGETEAEIIAVLEDLRAVDVDRLTLGQYLSPTGSHLPVEEYIRPEVFAEWKQTAEGMGFTVVESHPFARSSYYGPEQLESLSVLRHDPAQNPLPPADPQIPSGLPG